MMVANPTMNANVKVEVTASIDLNEEETEAVEEALASPHVETPARLREGQYSRNQLIDLNEAISEAIEWGDVTEKEYQTLSPVLSEMDSLERDMFKAEQKA